ncbi:MAG: hypothetical protein AAFX80_19605, partial [Cyanobacteria bacterium J06639_18]
IHKYLIDWGFRVINIKFENNRSSIKLTNKLKFSLQFDWKQSFILKTQSKFIFKLNIYHSKPPNN